jgi:peptide/nickel transport system ATP-binding protein
MSLLSARRLTLSARLGRDNVDVLSDISFDLASGEILGVVGESGAGKSMIGRLISQILPAGFGIRSGSLEFNGGDLLLASPARHRELLGDRIAFIPQEPLSGLNPVLTVYEQFNEHLGRLGVARAERRQRAINALASVQLPRPAYLLDKYSFQLSGGMCQRVLIAMAFASNPALLVADEPTTALDVITQAHIVELIRTMNREHRTGIIFITHDLRLAARICDKILVLYAGEVIESGPASAIFSDPRHPYTRALQAANPPLTGPRRQLMALPEQMPGLQALAGIEGCRFGARCPIADGDCRRSRSELRDVGHGHFVRCSRGCEAGARRGEQPSLPQAPIIPAAAPVVLELEGVSKYYAGIRTWYGRRRPGVMAVKPVDLAIRAGELVGVVGESGSGKSTLARLVMGLERPTTGSIVLEGKEIAAVPGSAAWRHRVAATQMVFQDPQSALNPRRRVIDLLTQAFESAIAPRHGDKGERARELASEIGLPADVLSRYPHQLSGGQKQRVNIARALCMAPRLLVADEIVSGLDVSVQAQILNLLLRLREERNISILFISHDLSVVRYLCSRVLVMHRGDVVETGLTEDVFARPQHAYTRALLRAVPPDEAGQSWTPLQEEVVNDAA